MTEAGTNHDLGNAKLPAVSKTASFVASLGFREGTTSVHTSRTMMLDELVARPANASAPNGKADAYVAAIVEENVLGKPTQTTRQRTAQRLGELYALDPTCTAVPAAAALLAGRPRRPGPCWRSSPPPPATRCCGKRRRSWSAIAGRGAA